MNMEKNYKILGVRIDNLSQKEILAEIESFLNEEKFHQIATINPEFILEAQNNLCFRTVLNKCALNVADGFGIKLAFWRYGWNLKARIAGADLLQKILKIAQQKKLKIFLAINKDGLSSFEEIKKAILKIYPNLQIEGASLDCYFREDTKPIAHSLTPTLDSRLRLPTGQAGGNDTYVLFCNFGAPHQETFLDSQKDAKIRLAMGVGGSFDFLTKKVRRAPIFMRYLGLEWLWRVFQAQSWEYKKKRLKRIWKAVVIFPIKILLCQEK
jgi:N-acetylglucosaminyldiphosphoundecaprenol N-acetyl-beta-D-mannosaminyltransferase